MTSIGDDAFDTLAPMQWPARAGERPAARLFGRGGYFTADGKARFIAVDRPAPKADVSPRFRFRLNTGRVRDQWHTMSRTGLRPRLAGHLPEPFVEVHPRDAASAKLTDGGFARVSTAHGACTVKVVVSPGQQRGSLFVPIHWSDVTASSARVCDLVAPHCDPHSGQPDAKAPPAAIVPVSYRYRGFAVRLDPHDLPPGVWWSRVTLERGIGLLLAADSELDIWRVRAGTVFAGAEIAEYLDAADGVYRAAAFCDGRLRACLFVGPRSAPPRWDAIVDLFAADTLDLAQRQAVLTGRSEANGQPAGPLVCACFGVGRDAIEAAIGDGARSADEIGKVLRAGTNCGSCLPEIKAVLRKAILPKAVATAGSVA